MAPECMGACGEGGRLGRLLSEHLDRRAGRGGAEIGAILASAPEYDMSAYVEGGGRKGA